MSHCQRLLAQLTACGSPVGVLCQTARENARLPFPGTARQCQVVTSLRQESVEIYTASAALRKYTLHLVLRHALAAATHAVAASSPTWHRRTPKVGILRGPKHAQWICKHDPTWYAAVCSGLARLIECAPCTCTVKWQYDECRSSSWGSPSLAPDIE